jgi:ATP-dependent protease Clp ATPase subunit
MFQNLDSLINKGSHKKVFEAFEGSANINQGSKKGTKKGSSSAHAEKEILDEKQRRELYEIVRSFIPRLMLYIYMSEFSEEDVQDITQKTDQAIFQQVTRLTVPIF